MANKVVPGACLVAVLASMLSLLFDFVWGFSGAQWFIAICYAIILMMSVIQVRLMAGNGIPLYMLITIIFVWWAPPIGLIKIIIFNWMELAVTQKLQVQIYGLLGSVAITSIALSEFNFREKVKVINYKITSFRLTVATIYPVWFTKKNTARAIAQAVD